MSHAKPLPKELTQETAIASAKAFGMRLAFLIHNAKISDEVKESLVTLVPEMTPEQLDRLSDLFMADWLNQQTQDIDDKFKRELEKIKALSEKEEEKILAKANTDLNKLEQAFRDLNNKKD